MSIRTWVADAITGGGYSENTRLAEAGQQGVRVLAESTAELQAELLGRDGDGWQVMSDTLDGKEMSRDNLRKGHHLAFLMYLKNPYIRRAVNVRTSYVLGQGVTVHSPNKDANKVLQEFWDDPSNRRALTSPGKLRQRDRELQLFGNVFLMRFVNKATGRVQLRPIDVDEIDNPITDPGDKHTVWFWPRTYNKPTLNQSGVKTVERVTEYHPDINYNPAQKWATFSGAPVLWDRPIRHVQGEIIGSGHIAPSLLLSVLDWARTYTTFLRHRFTVSAALSQWVHKISAGTKKGVNAVVDAVKSTFAGGMGAPGAPGAAPAGGAAIVGDGRNVEAMTVKGATIDPEEGRRFLLAVCAGADFPETFFGDVSVGSLATAESLDQPTNLRMEEARSTWTGTLTDVALDVLVQAARSPLNPFSKVATLDYSTGSPVVMVKNSDGKMEPAGIDVDYPPIIEHNVKDRVTAIVTAAPHLPLKKLIARLLLVALKEDDVDEALALLPDDVKLNEWPEPPAPAPIVPTDDPQDKKPVPPAPKGKK